MLGRLWAGRVYGTNTGNLYLEMESSENDITGTLRLLDSQFGLTVYKVSGTYDGTLRIRGEPIHVQEGVDAGIVDATAILTPQGHLRGEWRSAIGTAGTFEAYPHDIPLSGQGQVGHVPEQIYTAHIPLGALRLYGTDLDDLVQFVRKDFIVGRIIVTYGVSGNEVTKYYEDFVREAPALGEIRYLKISVQEPEAHGINKVVIVEFSGDGLNEVRVQGINESWVTGKAEAIGRTLRKYERGLVTTFRKFGLTLNPAIFLAMLIVIPAIESLWQRTAFVAIVVTLLGIIYWAHRRYIPNAIIHTGVETPAAFTRMWPSILSWFITTTATLAATYAFYLLTGNSP